MIRFIRETRKGRVYEADHPNELYFFEAYWEFVGKMSAPFRESNTYPEIRINQDEYLLNWCKIKTMIDESMGIPPQI